MPRLPLESRDNVTCLQPGSNGGGFRVGAQQGYLYVPLPTYEYAYSYTQSQQTRLDLLAHLRVHLP